MSEERPMIHIRLPKSLVKRVDHMAVDWDMDRARTVEHLLEIALGYADSSNGEKPELAVVGGNSR